MNMSLEEYQNAHLLQVKFFPFVVVNKKPKITGIKQLCPLSGRLSLCFVFAPQTLLFRWRSCALFFFTRNKPSYKNLAPFSSKRLWSLNAHLL